MEAQQRNLKPLKEAAVWFMVFELSFWGIGARPIQALWNALYYQDWAYMGNVGLFWWLVLFPLGAVLAWLSFVLFLKGVLEYKNGVKP
jgi:ABC-type dipeptide/oligopeptide/nickel transport system permease subunit